MAESLWMFPKSIGKSCKLLTVSLIEDQKDASKSQNSLLALVRNEYNWINRSILMSKLESLGIKTWRSSSVVNIELMFASKSGKIYATVMLRCFCILKK